ncbi:hypothetical protein VM1G_11708 [Cytospora mali]|uniref:Uncharacterized protein n=1 Tax=Cytospora mali TaxID=578113 RepID=A0A194W1R0_CYTMA|nr:hypothetical protein VM1G_11708 [Valsa mali]
MPTATSVSGWALDPSAPSTRRQLHAVLTTVIFSLAREKRSIQISLSFGDFWVHAAPPSHSSQVATPLWSSELDPSHHNTKHIWHDTGLYITDFTSAPVTTSTETLTSDEYDDWVTITEMAPIYLVHQATDTTSAAANPTSSDEASMAALVIVASARKITICAIISALFSFFAI